DWSPDVCSSDLGGAERVVREPRDGAEELLEPGDGAEVHVARRGGVRAHASEEREPRIGPAPDLADGGDGARDLLEGGHARRHDDGLLGAGDPAQELEVDELEARDLVGGDLERLEEVDGARVEGRGEGGAARLVRRLEDRRV